jgi:hypothetical protein
MRQAAQQSIQHHASLVLVFSTPVAAGATAILYEAFRPGVVFCGRCLENLEKEGEADREAGAG